MDLLFLFLNKNIMRIKLLRAVLGMTVLLFTMAPVSSASSCTLNSKLCSQECPLPPARLCMNECAGLPSYPTYEYEDCLTLCADEDLAATVVYNDCNDQCDADNAADLAIYNTCVEQETAAEAEAAEAATTEAAEAAATEAAEAAATEAAEAAATEAAEVTEEKPITSGIEGDVKIKKSDGSWVDVEDGFTLSEGDSIKTSNNSKVTITFKDGSTIQLGSNSKFSNLGENSKSKDFELSYGWIKAKFKKILLKRFTVRTPTAVHAVRGTEFILTHDLDTDLTELHLSDGAVEVTPTATNEMKEYSEGTKVIIDENGVKEVLTLSDSDWTDLVNEFDEEEGLVTVVPFPDVAANHVHIEGINYGQINEIFKGYPDGTFKPDNPVNRAEFTKIVVNAIYPDKATGSNCFPDVKTEWFAPFVCYAQSKNILGGYKDGTFQPINSINFSEGAKIIVNTFGIEVDTSDPVWFKPFVEELGVRRAIPTTITDFGQLMTRGEMAEIVYRLLENVTDKPSQTYSGLESGELYDPYELYENNDIGFKVKHNEDWQVEESEFYGVPIAYLMSPSGDEGDFQKIVSFLAEDLSAQPMTLEEYSDFSLTQLEQLFADYKRISYRSTSLGGKRAKKVIYTASNEGQVFKVMQVWTIIDQKAYVLTYNVLENTFADFEKDVDDLVDSFEFL